MAIAWVRSHNGNGNNASATTITLTPVATIPVGNFLLIGATCGTTSTTATAADTGGNTYQVDRTHNSTVRGCHIISAKITTQLTTGSTITVTFSGSVASRTIMVEEFSGLHATTWLDPGKVNSAVGSSTTPDSGTVTTTTAGSMLFGACHFSLAGTAYAPGTTNAGAYAYTEAREQQAGAANFGEIEYYLGAASGVTVSANGTITSSTWTQNIAVYLPAAAAAGNTGGMFEVM